MHHSKSARKRSVISVSSTVFRIIPYFLSTTQPALFYDDTLIIYYNFGTMNVLRGQLIQQIYDLKLLYWLREHTEALTKWATDVDPQLCKILERRKRKRKKGTVKDGYTMWMGFLEEIPFRWPNMTTFRETSKLILWCGFTIT